VLQYGVTREALSAVVEEGDGWDMLHFSGHGLPASLVLEKLDGMADVLASTELVELLGATRGRLKLVTLSACLSAAPVEETLRELGLHTGPPVGRLQADGQSNGEAPPAVARALVRELDCAVLAMRFPVVDDFAIGLGAGLYDRLLGHGQPLPRALQLGLRAALLRSPTPEAPPVSAATPALFGRHAADLKIAGPKAEDRGFVVVDTGFAYFPDEPERFVGRVAALSRARQALAPESGKTGVLLQGMAGVGKTACALELAYGYEGAFAAFVWHKAPEVGRDIAGALAALALDMEQQVPGLRLVHLVDQVEALLAWLPVLTQFLEDNRILLVLDNLESLLTPDGQWRDARWGALVAACHAPY
jgi:hypothetical protein